MGMNDIRCKVCGRRLRCENGILMEDAFEAVKEWGFFSKKDLVCHKFVMCENCYDSMIEKFAIPVKVFHKNEVM